MLWNLVQLSAPSVSPVTVKSCSTVIPWYTEERLIHRNWIGQPCPHTVACSFDLHRYNFWYTLDTDKMQLKGFFHPQRHLKIVKQSSSLPPFIAPTSKRSKPSRVITPLQKGGLLIITPSLSSKLKFLMFLCVKEPGRVIWCYSLHSLHNMFKRPENVSCWMGFTPANLPPLWKKAGSRILSENKRR